MSVFSNDASGGPVLSVTAAASEVIFEARAAESDPERLGLFVEVNGERDGAYTYDMWFEAVADASPRDAVVDLGGLKVVVAAQSIGRIQGATLDLGTDGLVMLNPNTPAPAPGSISVPESDLSSPIELAVLEILEREINPQIAMHGGRADLVAVDEAGTAYLRLSGGCQGCGLAAVTLSQGISVAIREAIPQIIEIVDVTAHEAGSNPYFESAKK